VIALASGLAGVVSTKDDNPGEGVNFRRSVDTTVVFSALVEAPSSAPSISMIPSSIPSTTPSSAPSSTPFLAPSSAPSDVRCALRSTEFRPLHQSATIRIPLVRSVIPAVAYTKGAPSSAPTISMMPTFGEFDEDIMFRLEMYWKRGYRLYVTVRVVCNFSRCRKWLVQSTNLRLLLF